jgi:hypothetical protein
MTGFGSASNYDFTVEVRSLNHRFIDISIKRHEQSRNPVEEYLKCFAGEFNVFSQRTLITIPFSQQKLSHIYSSWKHQNIFAAWRDHHKCRYRKFTEEDPTRGRPFTLVPRGQSSAMRMGRFTTEIMAHNGIVRHYRQDAPLQQTTLPGGEKKYSNA